MYSPNTGASSSSSSSRNVQQLKDDGRNVDPKKRTSITMLVLGDEGVGKSSLISTFVSRHFSEVVPGIMTRVRLPPDPENSCITTIVDSQGGDAALITAVANMSTATTMSNTMINVASNNDGVGSVGGIGGGNSIISGGERGGGIENTTASSPSVSVSIAPTTPGSTYLGGVNNSNSNDA